MKRKPHPNEELVHEIRRQITSQSFLSISDDQDMYYVKVAGDSPMLRQEESNADMRCRARELAEQLVEIGEPAVEAVALGLRMQGRWREELLPFAERFCTAAVIHEALVLVAKRQRDPLAAAAAKILDGPRPKRSPGQPRRPR